MIDPSVPWPQTVSLSSRREGFPHATALNFSSYTVDAYRSNVKLVWEISSGRGRRRFAVYTLSDGKARTGARKFRFIRIRRFEPGRKYDGMGVPGMRGYKDTWTPVTFLRQAIDRLHASSGVRLRGKI